MEQKFSKESSLFFICFLPQKMSIWSIVESLENSRKGSLIFNWMVIFPVAAKVWVNEVVEKLGLPWNLEA